MSVLPSPATRQMPPSWRLRLFGEVCAAYAVKCLLAVFKIFLGKVMEPYAFHDGIGKYGGTGFLQVVRSNSAPVHHLVPHAGGLVLVGKHGINQFLIDAFSRAFWQAMDSGMTSMVSISAMAYQPIALSQKFSDSPVTLSHQNIWRESS